MTPRVKGWLWILGLALSLTLLAIFVPNDIVVWLTSVWIFLAIIPATYFPIFYTVAFRWWESHLGRALFIKGAGLGLLIDISAAYAIWGDDYVYRDYVRFVVFSMVLVGLYYQSIVMTKIRLSAVRPRTTTHRDGSNDSADPQGRLAGIRVRKSGDTEDRTL